jgi:thioredoxin-related protein
MRILLRVVLLAVCFLAPSGLTAQSSASADTILSQAEASATQQHKLVFVIFRASWCGMCRSFERYVESPDIRPIIDKYFVVVRMNALESQHPERNTTGAADFLKQFGGGDSVPFLVILDGSGRMVVNSVAPKIGNIGYPVEPGEIDWFMKMLSQSLPSMTSEEARRLEARLRHSQ